MSQKPATSLASVTDNYLLYSDKTDLANKPEPFHNHDVDIKAQESYPLNEAKVDTVVIVETPLTITQQSTKNGQEQEQAPEQEQPAPEWDMLTSFYFGSLTVVGLYVFFKLLQKSK